MARWLSLLLLLGACSHDTSGLRRPAGTDADVDARADAANPDAGTDAGPADAGLDAGPVDAGLDAGPVDAGPVDAGFACVDFTYESAPPGVGTAGNWMESTALQVWRFRVDRAFRPTEVGFMAEALSGGSFQGAVFRLDGSGDDPDGIFFGTSDVMVQASRSISASVVQDISIPFTDAPRLAPGWYAVGVKLVGGGPVRFYGNSPTGERPYRVLDSGTTRTGAQRLFVRGCRALP